jgi:hypothetical protein
MRAAPAEFRRRIRAHNFHAIIMAGLSLVAAVAVWNLAYFFFVLILLGLTTAVRGDEGPAIPPWIAVAALAGAGGVLVWGLVDRWLHRYSGLSDRAIVGPHVVADVALLPVRLTLAIWGNLGAILVMGRGGARRAWDLLAAISAAGKAPLGSLTLVERDAVALHRQLRALQLLACVELHAGREDWYYTVRGNLGDALKRRLAAPESS